METTTEVEGSLVGLKTGCPGGRIAMCSAEQVPDQRLEVRPLV